MRYILLRLALLVPTLLGVLAVTFALLYLAPGDPVAAIVGERADAAAVARARADLRLDDPIAVRFGRYVAGVARGDLGRSYITRRPIVRELRQRFPATLKLACAAMLIAVTLGLAVGIWGAVRPGSWGDRIATLGAYLGISFPVYWVGLLLILGFAVTLRWFPPSGYGGLLFLVLPAVTLGMRSIAFLARMTRSAMREVLTSELVRTARAKGLPARTVILRHALGNALLPIITVVGLDFGSYLTGSILTETIFSWPGVGRYILTAIDKRDLPAIQGGILFLSLVFVLVNLITDLCYAAADPRVAHDRS
ncbi:MAG: ABC transporter permease [Gemmatimonadales bacterium]|nr:ABC transporter permease [Gemmatimonadales bacterium]MBP6570700.1 ABC transporter permease [Gemmatimonadales bacterium]MBP7619452.1 ABC transporter permease [Gemmatimonadales bacterium]MBP9899629.1 ABC transporter permease [Gemmatimonadales bacterium]